MASQDIYQLTLFSAFRSQEFVNTFFYRQFGDETEPELSAAVLASLFEEKFFQTGSPLIAANFMSTLQYRAVRVRNLFNLDDFNETVFDPPYVGTNTGDGMPPFVAYSFRTPWLGGAVRRGFKRFGGVPELAADDGTLSGSTVTNLTILAGYLGDTLTLGSASYVPVIVARVRELNPETGKIEYKLPLNQSQAYAVAANSWSVQPELTTQSSRKIGRGS